MKQKSIGAYLNGLQALDISPCVKWMQNLKKFARSVNYKV